MVFNDLFYTNHIVKTILLIYCSIYQTNNIITQFQKIALSNSIVRNIIEL